MKRKKIILLVILLLLISGCGYKKAVECEEKINQRYEGFNYNHISCEDLYFNSFDCRCQEENKTDYYFVLIKETKIQILLTNVDWMG